MNMQSYKIESGNHESGVRIHLTSESDDLLDNQKELGRAPWIPAPIKGQGDDKKSNQREHRGWKIMQ